MANERVWSLATIEEFWNKVKSLVSGYKIKQTAVSDPSASGTGVTFIDSISQNANGVIVPTKKTVRTITGATASTAGSAGLAPAPAAGDQGKFLKGDGTWDDALSTELASVESGLAYRETGATASRNISDGEYVFWNGAMYKANGNIASGTTLASGTNLTPTENALNALNSKLATLGTVVDIDGSLKIAANSISRIACNPTIPSGYKVTGVTLIARDPNGWVNAQLIYNPSYNGWEVFGFNNYTAETTFLYKVRFYIAKNT